MATFQVVTDKYFTGGPEEGDADIKEEITEVEADSFALDNHGNLVLFTIPPEVSVANADGQEMRMPRNPTPVHAFADMRWVECRKKA